MVNGIVPIYKEAGFSSFSYVSKLKKIFNQKKVGHTGTLDPMVKGVLPICLGSATKLVPFLMEQKKAYLCTILIGKASETEDLEGNIISSKKVIRSISEQEIDLVLSTFKGKNYQVPPFFSAVRYHGKRLYEFARQNIFIEKPARLFQIDEIKRLTAPKLNRDGTLEFNFEVRCSKGTYIRTLCTQIGEKLNYPALMKNLIRTESGGFCLKDTVRVDELKNTTRGIYSIEEILKNFPSYNLSNKQYIKVSNGAELSIPRKESQLVFKYSGKVVAIYQNKHGIYKARTMFLDNINANNKN